ncbi:MAG TPA: DegT/DnrJ/EryC1/StrS family aminotransferase [Candidatus Cloacimonadota bacterium]|nr:DegT/DnrJ/EryC1/StrS family aminotransferase [Candidatus Cloacimonadota bacterium]
MKVPMLDLQAQYAPIMADIRSEMEKVFAIHAYKLGPQVYEFEHDMEKFCDVAHAIGCASGTDAILLALLALGLGEGDEVITTPFTFFATAGTIYRAGARPVFVDAKPDTYNIDPDKIEVAITPRTKAIIAVHLFGQPAEMDKIMSIAQKHNLKVIEDNAQGVGAKYDGKTAGTIGDIGTLSFFPSKNLGAMGDGGMCLTNNTDLANKLFQLRVHGENPQYFHKWVGLNSRLDTLQAAVLLVKLRSLAKWSEARRKNADYYYQNMSDIKQIKLPVIHPKAESIFNQFTLVAEDRDELLKYLRSQGIGCAVYYPLPLHLQECFSYLNYQEGDFPVAEKLAKTVISIPVFSEITQEQQDHVIAKIREFYS